MIEVKLDTKSFERAMKVLDPKLINRAASKALNDAARATRTVASKEIRAKFNLPAARVNKEVKNIRMARVNDLQAVIQAEGRPIGLMNFGAKWIRNVGGKARTTSSKKSTIAKRKSKNTGVVVPILKGKRTRLPNAFIGKARRGRMDGQGALHVFQRTKSGLINKATITIASMMSQKHVLKAMTKKAEETFEKRFWYHYKRYIDKA